MEKREKTVAIGAEKYERTVESAKKGFLNALEPYWQEFEDNVIDLIGFEEFSVTFDRCWKKFGKNIKTFMPKHEKAVILALDEYEEVAHSAWEGYMKTVGQCNDKDKK